MEPTEAVTNPGPQPGPFADKVQALDAALTGKDSRTVANTWRNDAGRHNPANWPCAGEYHLSDGGYSRLGWNHTTSRLFLTSNSRDEAKTRWANCRELIADVEAAVVNAQADDQEVCPYCGADRHDGCHCHKDILGFSENCPSD